MCLCVCVCILAAGAVAAAAQQNKGTLFLRTSRETQDTTRVVRVCQTKSRTTKDMDMAKACGAQLVHRYNKQRNPQ